MVCSRDGGEACGCELTESCDLATATVSRDPKVLVHVGPRAVSTDDPIHPHHIRRLYHGVVQWGVDKVAGLWRRFLGIAMIIGLAVVLLSGAADHCQFLKNLTLWTS